MESRWGTSYGRYSGRKRKLAFSTTALAFDSWHHLTSEPHRHKNFKFSCKEFQRVWSQSTNVTDGLTDRQLITAIRPRLLLNTNRKPHKRFRLVPKSWRNHDASSLRFDTIPLNTGCDRQTDSQTDRHVAVPKAQYTPPTPTRRNCFVASCRRRRWVHEFATSSRRLPTLRFAR